MRVSKLETTPTSPDDIFLPGTIVSSRVNVYGEDTLLVMVTGPGDTPERFAGTEIHYTDTEEKSTGENFRYHNRMDYNLFIGKLILEN